MLQEIISGGEIRILLSVACAMLLGGLLGIEREQAEKPAGFRTHKLVAGAAALLVGLGDVLTEHFNAEAYSERLRIDPLRIVEAIVAGVSFLGAGTIFRHKDQSVNGLTTAASLLLASAIGISVALNQYILAIGVTALTLIVLRVMRLVDRWL
jgi:putative Mg2+ transporter-C (MgtC) family protein